MESASLATAQRDAGVLVPEQGVLAPEQGVTPTTKKGVTQVRADEARSREGKHDFEERSSAPTTIPAWRAEQLQTEREKMSEAFRGFVTAAKEKHDPAAAARLLYFAASWQPLASDEPRPWDVRMETASEELRKMTPSDIARLVHYLFQASHEVPGGSDTVFQSERNTWALIHTFHQLAVQELTRRASAT
ncbi:MAG TPA: hypothetical protein VHA82_08015 [Ramlibacter sp.]|uniref:hypothetical protein n=1 Tax=Ramlibacter sp. TaxID=1917967 RepID=UPI002C7CA4BF|nr:hypothetical protein [Ramlibacter sp.]HVZ43742.1 hypothetical protein [Ramlibacter sp.]